MWDAVNAASMRRSSNEEDAASFPRAFLYLSAGSLQTMVLRAHIGLVWYTPPPVGPEGGAAAGAPSAGERPSAVGSLQTATTRGVGARHDLQERLPVAR